MEKYSFIEWILGKEGELESSQSVEKRWLISNSRKKGDNGPKQEDKSEKRGIKKKVKTRWQTEIALNQLSEKSPGLWSAAMLSVCLETWRWSIEDHESAYRHKSTINDRIHGG